MSLADPNPNVTPSDATRVQGGKLPSNTVQLIRVVYNRRTLVGKTSDWVRQQDSQYQKRQGDPQIYTFDKDGSRFLRLVPSAGGQASYNDVRPGNATTNPQARGSIKYSDDYAPGGTITPSGTRGILRSRTTHFPSGGPWGTVVRTHTEFWNICCHIYRTGRNLDRFGFELPDFFLKYVYYYAMSMALRREGPGQDMKMAEHYLQRFEMGVSRLLKLRRDLQRMRLVMMGAGVMRLGGWGIGEPTLPAYYPYYQW